MPLAQQMFLLFLYGAILGIALGSLAAAFVIPFSAPRTPSNKRAIGWFAVASVGAFLAYFGKFGSISSIPAWSLDAPNTVWYIGLFLGGLVILGLLERGLRESAAAVQPVEQPVEPQ